MRRACVSTALHRFGATILVAIGLVGAFGGLVIDRAEQAQATSNATVAVSVERLAADADVVIEAAAEAMSEVTSVRFAVTRSGAPVYIDPVESLALDRVTGRFRAPSDADALVTVTVGGELTTELAAVALGSEIWLSNPITGVFEPLPPSYNIDPSKFFDPTGGWQPLLVGLTERTLVADEGDQYHVRGTAPAADLRRVTAGLVRAEGIVIDLWIDSTAALVDRIEFSVEDRHGVSDWALELSDYGQPFDIALPVEEDG